MLRGKIDKGQLSILELIKQVSEKQNTLPDNAGSFNIDASLREMISQSLKNTKLSRYEVASEMSRLLGKEISKTTVDTWSAESKENHRFPLSYLNAFIKATGDKSILRFICEISGGCFIEGEDALRLELGRIEDQKRDLRRKEETIKKCLTSLKETK